MGEKSNFEVFEQQFLKLIGELQFQNDAVVRLRAALGVEASRADAAEARRDAAARELEEARAEVAATAAGTAQLDAALAAAQQDLVTARNLFEISEREKCLLERRVADMSAQVNAAQRELATLRDNNLALGAQRAEFTELQKRTKRAVDEANSTSQRLESELRRVERAAGAGAELRERARLAAAAHTRERRIAEEELRHTTADLLLANAEITRLTAALKEVRLRTAEGTYCGGQVEVEATFSTAEWEKRVSELRGALAIEREGTARLQRALAALAADNQALAASGAGAEERKTIASATDDGGDTELQPYPQRANITDPGPGDELHTLTAIKAIDSFLLE